MYMNDKIVNSYSFPKKGETSTKTNLSSFEATKKIHLLINRKYKLLYKFYLNRVYIVKKYFDIAFLICVISNGMTNLKNL